MNSISLSLIELGMRELRMWGILVAGGILENNLGIIENVGESE